MRISHCALCLIVASAAGLAGCQNQPPVVVGQLPMGSIFDPSGPGPQPPPPQPKPVSPEQDWKVTCAERPWRWIVIHHSAGDAGSAAAFDREHRARGWDGLGYHFVIDNGNGGADGKVEVGSRWRQQKWGAHTGKTPDNAYNNYGIGICLVGDFTDHMPTPAQQESLNRLLAYLMARYHIDASCVIGHREAPGASTDCPGDKFYEYLKNTLRPSLRRSLAAK